MARNLHAGRSGPLTKYLIFLTFAVLAAFLPGDEPAQKSGLPYPETMELTWNWVIDGKKIGTTRARIRPSSEEGTEWILDARLQFSRSGRAIDSRSLTTFGGESRRLTRYRRDLRAGLPGGNPNSTVTSALFGTESTQVRVQNSSQPEISQQNFETGDNPRILDSQCFEHWLLIAPTLPAEGKGKIKVLVPTEQRFLDLEVTRELTEGEGADRLHRWSIRSETFQALIWVDDKGAIERYLQGSLDILREADSPGPQEEKK